MVGCRRARWTTSKAAAIPAKVATTLVSTIALVATLLTAVAVQPARADTAQTTVKSAATSTPAQVPGYWLVSASGTIYQIGTTNFGDLSALRLTKPIVGATPTADGLGYWLVASDGGVFAFGDAGYAGSTGAMRLNKPIVGMAVDPATGGYWLVASDGGIFAFGAPFYGSTGNIVLNKPVVGMAATPDGKGYWMVASDGGIFAFGDAGFYGSTGNIVLNKPVVSMAATASGSGYWMTATDGGIFAFGDAGYYGSTGNLQLAAPVESMSPSPDGGGYWLAAQDGGVFTFGDAPYLGSAANTTRTAPIISIMSTRNGYPFPPGSTGYDVSQWQCPQYTNNQASFPSAQTPVAIVQVSGGAINKSQQPACYQEAAAWAGPNISAYIFLDGLPGPAPAESLNGPAGNCAGSDYNCEGYNFGYYWATHWVNWSHSLGINPTLWWLDVEIGPGIWPCIDVSPACSPQQMSTAQQSNTSVIRGAEAGLVGAGVTPGIYSTNYQWGLITGYGVDFPGIALWMAGASSMSSAPSFCNMPAYDGPSLATSANYYSPFAGGRTVLVQHAPTPGTNEVYDQDYACA